MLDLSIKIGINTICSGGGSIEPPFFNDALFWGVKGASKDFESQEYYTATSNGTNDLIDAGFALENDDELYVLGNFNSVVGSLDGFGQTDATNGGRRFFGIDGGNWICGDGFAFYGAIGTAADTDEHLFKLTKDTFDIDGVQIQDTSGSAFGNSVNNFNLFAIGGFSGSEINFTMKYCIVKRNDKTTHFFLPQSDGTVLDVVTGISYTSSGAGLTATQFYEGYYNNFAEPNFSVPDSQTVGRVLTFNGVNAYAGLDSTIAFSGEFTVAMKVNRNDVNDTSWVLGSISSSAKVALQLSGAMFIRIINGGSFDGTIPILSPNTEYSLIIKRDSSNIVKISTDDGVSFSTLFGGVAQIGDFIVDRIGTTDTAGQFMSGVIYDTAFFSRCISDTESQDIYNTIINECQTNPDGIAYYAFAGENPNSATVQVQGSLGGDATLFNVDTSTDWSQVDRAEKDMTLWSDTSNTVVTPISLPFGATNKTFYEIEHTNSVAQLIYVNNQNADQVAIVRQIVRRKDNQWVNIQCGGAVSGFRCFFDLVNGVVGTGSSFNGATLLNAWITPIPQMGEDTYIIGIRGTLNTGDTAYNLVGAKNQVADNNFTEATGVSGYATEPEFWIEGTVRPSLTQKFGFNVANNLFVNSNNFSKSQWIKDFVVIGTNELDFSSGGSIQQTYNETIKVGDIRKTYFTLSGIDGETITIRTARKAGGEADNTDKQITLTSTPTRYYVEHTFNNDQAGFYGMIFKDSGDTANTVFAYNAQGIDPTTEDSGYYPTTGTAYDNVVIPADLSNPGFDLNGVALQYLPRKGMLNDNDLTKYRYADNALMKTADTDNNFYDGSGNQLDVSWLDHYYIGWYNSGFTYWQDLSKANERLIKNILFYNTAKTLVGANTEGSKVLGFMNGSETLTESSGLTVIDSDGLTFKVVKEVPSL